MEGRTVNSAPETDKLKEEGKSVSTQKKSKGGRNYKPKGMGMGGKRPGSGRKTKEETLIAKGVKELFDTHGLEMVDVVETDKATGQTRIVKKTRVQALLDVLYSEGHNKRNTSAIKEYLDRTAGKPVQGIALGGTINVKEQRVPTMEERLAARAYRQTLERERAKKEAKAKKKG
jgi:hypothetical protein